MIHVAVIARPGASLDACLAALGAAGVPEPSVVELARPGAYADARNRALLGCDAEVLALVEDDVAVSEGWLRALEQTWATDAAHGVAVVAGPLRAAFPAGRPAWLGDALLATFALHDAESRTFHGGNVTVRAAALRGIGGFWPAHGHRDARDWFSEEHHAQRELARAGWGAAFAADAAAERLVPADVRPRDLVRRRLRYGARLSLVGEPRGTGAAARALASGLAGAPAALATGDRGRAVERAARAAENAGVLAAGLIAHGELQPATHTTPFRHSVPGPQPGPLRRALPSRPRRRGTGMILMYHRVAEREHDPLALSVSPQHFAEQLAAVRDELGVATLEEVAGGAAGVAVTLDDGYADSLHAALPALHAAGVPATLFVSTEHVAERRAFWWDAVSRLLRAAPADAGPLRLTLRGDKRAWPARDDAEREEARRHLHAWLQPRAPQDIKTALDAMAAWAGVDGDPLDPPADERPLTLDELRTLAAAGTVTIAAHGRSHRSLAPSPPDIRRDEIAGSGDDLAEWLGTQPRAFSYPFGVPGTDVDAATAQTARDVGYALAVVNAPGVVARDTDRFLLPRFVASDVDGAAFATWLRGLHK